MEEALLLIQKIKAMYQSKAFSKSDQSIAEYILNDPGCLAGATANSLAEASGTSPATVIRFCRKLGFTGFTELKNSASNYIVETARDMSLRRGDDAGTVKSKVISYTKMIMDELDEILDNNALEKAAELIAAVQAALGGNGRAFYAGVSYRHCLIYKNCPAFTDYTRPHDILGKTIRAYLPQRRESAPFLEMQKRSFDLLNAHPLNLRRAAQGLKKATSLGFWGPGKKPSLPPFSEKYGLRATVVSAVDLIKGIGVCAGMRVVDVPGATGTLDTNYRGKLEAAADALLREGSDLVYIHVEAPDECGHRGELMNKVAAIERIDAEILGPLLKRMNDSGEDYAVLLLPDHPTPVRVRTHTHAPVPFVVYRRSQEAPSGFSVYDEESGRRGGVRIENGFELMEYFLARGREREDRI